MPEAGPDDRIGTVRAGDGFLAVRAHSSDPDVDELIWYVFDVGAAACLADVKNFEACIGGWPVVYQPTPDYAETIMPKQLPLIDLSWGLEALRERLRGAHISHADLQRRYDQLAADTSRLRAAYQGLYELLSPEVKAAIECTRQEQAAQSRNNAEAVLHAIQNHAG